MADKAKEQHNNILLAVAGFSAVVVIVALIGFLFSSSSNRGTHRFPGPGS